MSVGIITTRVFMAFRSRQSVNMARCFFYLGTGLICIFGSLHFRTGCQA